MTNAYAGHLDTFT